MNKTFLLIRYFNYILNAKDEHSLHSPFAYDFYTKVIKGKDFNPEFNKIEQLRKSLKKNLKTIEIVDLGAGSGVTKSNTRTIASISNHSKKNTRLAQLIFRIIKTQQPCTVIDLGTSLGLTTLYESLANPNGKIFTFEGCPSTAEVAENNFKKIHAQNIQLIVGNIDTSLPKLLEDVKTVDFVFFDANHRYEPTMRYFSQCLKKANENSIFIFDDIYWSSEMEKAWNDIKAHSSVTMSIDLFYLGIIFFRKKQPVQHFILK